MRNWKKTFVRRREKAMNVWIFYWGRFADRKRERRKIGQEAVNSKLVFSLTFRSDTRLKAGRLERSFQLSEQTNTQKKRFLTFVGISTWKAERTDGRRPSVGSEKISQLCVCMLYFVGRTNFHFPPSIELGAKRPRSAAGRSMRYYRTRYHSLTHSLTHAHSISVSIVVVFWPRWHFLCRGKSLRAGFLAFSPVDTKTHTRIKSGQSWEKRKPIHVHPWKMPEKQNKAETTYSLIFTGH